MRSRSVFGASPSTSVRLVSTPGRRIGRTDVEERLEEPLATLDRRRAADVRRDRQQRALAEQPAPHVQLRPQRHAAELRSVDVGNPVVLREPLVDERVIGRQQIEDAAVFVNDAAEEQLDFAPESLRAACCRNPETGPRRARWPAMPRTFSHWPVKFSTNACERGRRSSARPAAPAPPASCSVPCDASSISSSSGMLLHRKNDRREASSRSLMP